MPIHPSPAPDPGRFAVSRVTLWFDRFMGRLIRVGGVAVILAVLGIFVFVGKEVLPLFRGAEIESAGDVESTVRPRVLGVDEWGEMPFFYDGGRSVVFVSIANGTRLAIDVPGLPEVEITAVSYDPLHQRVSLGLEDGRVGSFRVEYQRGFQEDGNNTLEPGLVAEPWFTLDHGTGPVTAISHGDSGSSRLIAVRRGEGDTATVSLMRIGIKRGLVGAGKPTLLGETDITGQLGAAPVMLRASQNGSMLLVACANGGVDYFRADTDGVSKRQTFHPFGNSVPAQMDFLFGGVSVIATSDHGEQTQWSLFRMADAGERLFGETKRFPDVDGGTVFVASQRNRNFLTAGGKALSIRHSTSGDVRWSGETDLEIVAAALDAKGEFIITADRAGHARRLAVHDPHPEAGWRAFFGKVWYEGGPGPVYQWQSTGGSDDFEPKFSLIPLIFGSLKGTAYALAFSIPIALLAAIFSAAFLPPGVKQVVKPVMEIMASLPSVVLGYLAGLWLAPLLETRVPSVLVAVLLMPLAALAAGYFWSRLPTGFRNRFAPGSEWIMVIPVIILAAWTGWNLGPLVESWLFVYQDPSGARIADFRLWWPQVTGSSFEQRNSLVLGFIMGFAVIPVIFTIAEDALSNVPASLTSAAAALGADRWQVVWTILLPVAASGIFSALIIGFGRAVGETMIMVMATGNTPITEWNLFNGMRTLSANLTVELPEAPEGSTHYRVLFLGAVILFLMTFVMNTIAELLRQRLRERNRIA